MFTNHTPASSGHSMSKWLKRIPWLFIPVMLFSFAIANAQQLTATLSGLVTDPSEARVPGAKVVVSNEATGDTRETKADNQGYFSVTALIPGSYKVTITAKSFATWEETGILLNQGDSRSVPNIKLKIGSEATAVTVISGSDAEVPIDTAEVSATLNNELVDSAILTGRNAAELIKMMPGVTFNNAGGAGSSYNGQVTGTNNGPAGSFSANGTQPYGSTAVILDGANLIDPGNAGTQVANINQDMTDSVKFLSASYGAEYAKGPAILQAFSKSGGQKFHGEGYVYARNSAIGYANDWDNEANGKPLPVQNYYYLGGNIGGPVFFPHFNHNRDKLFFWAGYEYMIQHPYCNSCYGGAPTEMNVPTAAQLSGDFTTGSVPSGVMNTYPGAYALPCNTNDGWQGCAPSQSPWEGTGTYTGLNTYFDPNGMIFTKMNPAANQTPTATNGWNNYGITPSTPQNRWEVTGKVTYSFNDNNKLWGSYTYQTETDDHPLSVWWAPEWTIPYPSEPIAKETAHVYLANYTHVFSATTTNEFVFSYAEFVNDVGLTNLAGTSRKALGFPAGSLFGSPRTDQIPNTTGGWAAGLTEINEFDFNSGIYGPNTFGKTSKAPAISDTFTKIIGTHSLKAGFYWDTFENLQANGSAINGNYDFETWGASSTYNLTLDRMMMRPQTYSEQNSDVVPQITQHEWSLWAQDSWKATRKLTLNIGLRLDHEGQWYDAIGGTQVWDPATYVNTPNPPADTGIEWQKIDSAIPASGWISPLFFYNPRLGFAYDVFGTGKTVVRAGFGTYRYQVSSNDGSAAMNGPLGSFSYATGSAGINGFYGAGISGGTVCTSATGGNNANCTATTSIKVPQGTNQVGTTVTADKMGDNMVPYANTWNFGIAQALPGHTVAEFSYVGSMSRNQLENGNNGHISDANPVPFGAFFTPDPTTGMYENIAPITPAGSPSGYSINGPSTNDWRALSNYQSIFVQTHGGYANYNSLQVSAQKQSGNLYMFTNFTFGKVLGTRDGSTSNGNGNGTVVNPFSLDSDYGPLEYDHTKTFNLSFSYKLPKPIHNNWALGEIINGWQLSNYTTYEDGIPYQAGTPNMNMNYQQYHCRANDPTAGCSGQAAGYTVNTAITMPIPATAVDTDSNKHTVVAGNQTYGIGTNEWLGSSQYENGLQPLVVCDPRKHLVKNQYFNPNCFAAPLPPTATAFGQEGQIIWPYIRTPHYFGSDLGIFKAFRVTDSQRVEIRVSATNWLNHPNAQFGLAGTSDNSLLFNGLSTGQSLTYNSNTSTTGIPQNKLGFRWLQFAGKYYF
jgi:hypothetical protein